MATMTDADILNRSGLERARAQRIVDDALAGADDGELYLEHSQSEAFVFDDNRLKSASYNVSQGFGLRAVVGESTGYAHASDVSEAALKRAAAAVQAVKTGRSGAVAEAPARTNARLYDDAN
ncbi:MAG: metalloprotease TldD, partial [Parvularculaceae bacterium]|nr:metalloprotease TldD [Parvularculaceae bacterium]